MFPPIFYAPVAYSITGQYPILQECYRNYLALIFSRTFDVVAAREEGTAV